MVGENVIAFEENVMQLPATTSRVSGNTPDFINQQIRREMEERIDFFAQHPGHIPERLKQLDQEWDIERVLTANAATLTVVGVLLGSFVDRKWLFLPAIVSTFLLQHALQGWCPPLPVFRRMGVRTAQEIEAERYALKALRGDFKDIPGEGATLPVMQAVSAY